MNYPIMADKQELMNKVCEGLAKQGFRRAVIKEATGEEVCRYLTDDGLKCAIGHLIPDGHSAQGELLAVSDICRNHPDLLDPKCDVGFLYKVQRAHDTANGPAGVRSNLLTLCAEYKLTPPDSLG